MSDPFAESLGQARPLLLYLKLGRYHGEVLGKALVFRWWRQVRVRFGDFAFDRDARQLFRAGEGFDWDFVTARRQLERAVSLGPQDPAVRHAYSDYFVVMGRTQESLDQVLLARDQNPGSLRALLVIPGHAVAARRYQEAIDEARGLLASHPEVRNARHFLARALWLTGRYEEAIAELGRLWESASEQLRVLDRAFGRAGPRAALEAVADYLAGQAETSAPNATEVAAYYAMAGEPDAAFGWLERAFAQRAPGLLHVPGDPFFDPIRFDPRIDELCRRVGLPIEAWRGPAASLPQPVEPG